MTHINEEKLTQSDENKQRLPQVDIYPLFKKYVVEVDKQSADNVEVVGFGVSKAGINVDCVISNRAKFPGFIPSDDAKKMIEEFLMSRFGITKLEATGWSLRDKESPYLLVKYIILSPLSGGEGGVND